MGYAHAHGQTPRRMRPMYVARQRRETNEVRRCLVVSFNHVSPGGRRSLVTGNLAGNDRLPDLGKGEGGEREKKGKERGRRNYSLNLGIP